MESQEKGTRMWGQETQRLAGLRILVVEDDQQIRSFFADEIQDNGAEVVTANNGKEALAIYQKDQAFDLILSDMRMPDGDGLFLLRRLRQGFVQPAPFILMSGFSDISIDEALQEGILQVFEKPLDWEALLDYMARFNARQQLGRVR